jgi:phage-related protein
MASKPLVWIGDSLERARTFAAAARKELGFELWEIQQGKPPSDWKPMSPVGPGVRELRVHSERAYRIIYLATLREAVYVLHAFEKQSRKAPKPDVELARNRFKALIQERIKR